MEQRKTLRSVESALWPLYLGDGLFIHSLIVFYRLNLSTKFSFPKVVLKKTIQVSICLNETFF